MKKMYYLMLLLLTISAASVNAQVTMGANKTPHGSALLDLQNADGSIKGLKLPGVALNADLTRFVLDDDADKATAVGMLVYNTTDNMVYMWNGSRWNPVSLDASLPIIITQPKTFSFTKDKNGSVPQLTVSAVGTGLKYQWYVKSKNKSADTKITGATNSYYAPETSALGLKRYYCIITNAKGSVTTDVAEVAVGCGAKTVNGDWMTFQCHNLGANTSLDPFTWSGSIPANPSATDTQDGIKGSLYQWGRNNDGHQLRTAGVYATNGPVELGENQEPVSGAGQGKFIKTVAPPWDWRTPQSDYMWRAHQNSTNDPCSSITDGTWRVPTNDEWMSIFNGIAGARASGQATANTWEWTDKGYAIKPDGQTTTLFLPAAGYRDNGDGALFGNIGLFGYYWSSSIGGNATLNIYFNSTHVAPGNFSTRAPGGSVRCVAQN